jgi:hypothetical protein
VHFDRGTIDTVTPEPGDADRDFVCVGGSEDLASFLIEYAPDVPEIRDYGDDRRWPEWSGPPLMMGGYVMGPLLMSQSDRVVVAVRQILAFPTGVEADVEGHARAEPTGPPGEQRDLAEHPSLRFRVQFADGSHAAQDDEAGLRSGHGPTLFVRRSESSSGGPDGPEDIRMTLWIWPLPPPGPVTLACSWPSRGLDEARVVLDADAVRAAASQAQPLWPSRET